MRHTSTVVRDDPSKYTEAQKEWLILRDRIAQLAVKERALREKLEAAPCEHPKVSTYSWEHDNGYGKQTMLTGHRCDFCGAKQAWPSMTGHWSTVKEWRDWASRGDDY